MLRAGEARGAPAHVVTLSSLAMMIDDEAQPWNLLQSEHIYLIPSHFYSFIFLCRYKHNYLCLAYQGHSHPHKLLCLLFSIFIGV